MSLAIMTFLSFLYLSLPGQASPSRTIPFNGLTTLSSPSTNDSAEAFEIVPNLTGSAIFCYETQRGPNLADCLQIEATRANDPELNVPYLLGFKGNYTGPFTWNWGHCEFQLHFEAQEQLLTTMQEIFVNAFYVAWTCSRQLPPKGGYWRIRQDGLSTIRAVRYLSPHVPSLIDPPSALNGIANLSIPSNPTLAKRNETALNSTRFVTCYTIGQSPDVTDCMSLDASRRSRPDFYTEYTFGHEGNYPGPYTWRYGTCEFQLCFRSSEDELQSTLELIFSWAVHIALYCGSTHPPRGGFVEFQAVKGVAIIRALKPQEPRLQGATDLSSAQNTTVNLSTALIDKSSNKLGKASNLTYLRFCVPNEPPPDLLDCLHLLTIYSSMPNYLTKYQFGPDGNYTRPLAWTHGECKYLMVVHGEDGWISTIQKVFIYALAIAHDCFEYNNPPRGGYAQLDPVVEGNATIFAVKPRGSRSPSGVDTLSPHDGNTNITSPAILSKACIPNIPGPNFDDCFAIFISESYKSESWIIQTFGPRGAYAGPYSWSQGRCEFQLDMKGVQFLSTTIAWILQTAVEVVAECRWRMPPEGGYARLDHPNLGVEIRVINPPAAVSQQKRALHPSESLSESQATPSNFRILPYVKNVTDLHHITNLTTLPNVINPTASLPPLSVPTTNLTSSYIDCPGAGATRPPDYVDCWKLTHLRTIPRSWEPHTFGRGGSYTGPYGWRFNQCEFSLKVVGRGTWRGSIQKVFELAQGVWDKCDAYDPPRAGCLIFTEREAQITIWVTG